MVLESDRPGLHVLAQASYLALCGFIFLIGTRGGPVFRVNGTRGVLVSRVPSTTEVYPLIPAAQKAKVRVWAGLPESSVSLRAVCVSSSSKKPGLIGSGLSPLKYFLEDPSPTCPLRGWGHTVSVPDPSSPTPTPEACELPLRAQPTQTVAALGDRLAPSSVVSSLGPRCGMSYILKMSPPGTPSTAAGFRAAQGPYPPLGTCSPLTPGGSSHSSSSAHPHPGAGLQRELVLQSSVSCTTAPPQPVPRPCGPCCHTLALPAPRLGVPREAATEAQGPRHRAAS